MTDNLEILPAQLRVRRDAMSIHLAYLILEVQKDPSRASELNAATLEMEEINNMIDRIRRQRQAA